MNFYGFVVQYVKIRKKGSFMAKVCPKCGREFENRSVRCPICKCDLEAIGTSRKSTNNSDKYLNESPKIPQEKTSSRSKNAEIREAQKNPPSPKPKLKASTIAFIAVSFFVLIGVASGGKGNDSREKSDNRDKTYEVNSHEEENVQGDISHDYNTEEKTQKATLDESMNLENELSEFLSGGYHFITNEDLNKYCFNMDGVKVYVVTSISDMKEGRIQSTLSENGLMMSDFNVGDNYTKYENALSKGDLIAICGIVSGHDDYGFMGTSVNLQDCAVFAVGESARIYEKSASDDELSRYFIVTEEVANSNDDVSENDYKSLCHALDYEDILRNPSQNEGKYCIVSGTVDQIIEGWFGAFSIFIVDSAGNKWGCVYYYKDGEPRLIEGDYVTVYGICDGTDTTTTVLGQQVTMPRVDLEYIY